MRLLDRFIPARARVLGTLAAAAALACVAVPATASAATVSLSGGVLTITPTPGQNENVTVNSALALGASVSGATAGGGCLNLIVVVECLGNIDSINADMGDGDDTLEITISVNTTALGGAGTDTITTASSQDTLDGGDGNDTLNSGDGNDNLIGGPGADVLNGGTGNDVADYSASSDPVAVSPDGTANDGADTNTDGTGEEGDNVANDIEGAKGGAGNDRLIMGAGDGTLDGGGGNDLLDGGTGNDTIVGGSGVDTVTYGSRTATVIVLMDGVANDGEAGGAGEGDNVQADVEDVIGGSGADALFGTEANNRLVGNGGNDILDGGPGADALEGGDGLDIVSYASRTASVAVDLDGQADDGEANEGDNVSADSEIVAGGAGNDVLIGNQGANALSGGAGNDLLDAGGGTDAMSGGPGADTVSYQPRTGAVTVTLDGKANDGEVNENDAVDDDIENAVGGAGNDTLTGDGANNVLVGLGGNDRIEGGKGQDLGNGGAGNDTILVRDDAADIANCGDGADTAQVDAKDTVNVDCESVDRPGTTPPPTSGEAGRLSIRTRSVKMTSSGLIRISVSCPESATGGCTGTLTVRSTKSVGAPGTKKRRRTFGVVSYTVSGGRSKTLRFRLAREHRSLVRTLKSVACTARAVSEGTDGDTATSSRSVRIRA